METTMSASASSSSSSSTKWSCSACTFLNCGSMGECEICLKPRVQLGRETKQQMKMKTKQRARSPLSSSISSSIHHEYASTESARKKRRRTDNDAGNVNFNGRSADTNGTGPNDTVERIRKREEICIELSSSSESESSFSDEDEIDELEDERILPRQELELGLKPKQRILKRNVQSDECDDQRQRKWAGNSNADGGDTDNLHDGRSTKGAVRDTVNCHSRNTSTHMKASAKTTTRMESTKASSSIETGNGIRNGIRHENGNGNENGKHPRITNRMDANTRAFEAKHKLVSSSSAKMVQKTLFGEIVRDIKKKNLNKLPNTIPEWDNIKTHVVPKQQKQEQPRPRPPQSQSKATQNGTFSKVRYAQRYERALHILKNTFKIPSLRNLQPQAIQNTLSGRSQIIVMATGGGKSMCYQLPATVLPGVTLVICPLIALMVDQVTALKKRGVEAAMISSSNSVRENKGVLQRLLLSATAASSSSSASTSTSKQSIKIVYCAPEQIRKTEFRATLTDLYQRGHLSLIAIDEAHCLSTWGHDFRPAYRELSWLRRQFSRVPCLACTATATSRVLDDIKEVLCFTKEDPCLKSTFNRENITYEICYKDNMGEDGAMKDLVESIKGYHETASENGAGNGIENKDRSGASRVGIGEECSGIVYVHKREDTVKIAAILQKSGVAAAAYHGQMKVNERKQVQKDWTEGKVKVAIATVAFGMGIDLAHVRYVMHWHMSKSIESFYQESGRAGRDGKPSRSKLYYSQDDASKFAFLIRKNEERKAEKKKGSRSIPSNFDNVDMKQLEKMIEYCTTGCCRRKYLLNHFGEECDPETICKKTCDYCIDPTKVEKQQNMSSVTKAIRDVKQQKFRYNKEPVFQGNIAEDDDDITNDSFDDYGSDLGITHYKSFHSSSGHKNSSSGFTSAKSILKHYEKLECSGTSGNKSGFVKFRAKDAAGEETKRSTSIKIPSHLAAKIEQKKAKAGAKKSVEEKSSKDIKSQAEKVQGELELIRQRREVLLAKMKKRNISKK